jgi:hypothetical protein
MINIIDCHFWCLKHGLCISLIILGQTMQNFKMKTMNLIPIKLVFLITNSARGYFKSMILLKLQKYTTKCALFSLLSLGRYEDILGQNHNILLKNHWKLWKLYNYFIIISILNPKEYVYNKCHRLSLYVSKMICLLQKSHYCPPEGRINTVKIKHNTLLQNFWPLGLYQCNGNDNSMSYVKSILFLQSKFCFWN